MLIYKVAITIDGKENEGPTAILQISEAKMKGMEGYKT